LYADGVNGLFYPLKFE